MNCFQCVTQGDELAGGMPHLVGPHDDDDDDKDESRDGQRYCSGPAEEDDDGDTD